MDYRKLLWKYIEWIRHEEGYTFMPGNIPGGGGKMFTDEEVKELNKLDSMGLDYVPEGETRAPTLDECEEFTPHDCFNIYGG